MALNSDVCVSLKQILLNCIVLYHYASIIRSVIDVGKTCNLTPIVNNVRP